MTTATRNAQKARRRARLAAIDLGHPDTRKQPVGVSRKDVFVTRTVRKCNHPRRDKGWRRSKRNEADMAQEALLNRQAENRARLAQLRMEGKPLPGQRLNPATVRK